jgi:tRNA modification GTPase
MHSLDDTIAAIASPPGGAARGIVRLSGPGLRDCLERCFRPDPYVPLASLAAPTAVPGLLWLGGFAAPLACDLYLWPGKRSYTGQPVAEIHTLGSPPILAAVLRTVAAGGARLAEPGEFTLRAFLSGRMDLTQAEAVLGVIEAESPEELDAALAQMAGGLTAPLGQLRDALVEILSEVEAGLDFAEEDIAFISSEQLIAQLDAAAAQVARLAERIAVRGDAAEATRVVLLGLPNAGKSSLFNALARGAGALVSHQPGTTRDYLTAELDLDGVRCQLIDTAGIDEREGRPESGVAGAAQAMAAEQARRAHVQVLCIDSSQSLPSPLGRGAGGGAPGESRLAAASSGRRLVVLTKADLATFALAGALETSSLTGLGLGTLRKTLREAVLHAIGPCGDMVAGTAIRAGESVRRAAECLDRARQIARTGRDEELLAAELRAALDELGKVAGAVYTEDLLDRIFSRFCIGK